MTPHEIQPVLGLAAHCTRYANAYVMLALLARQFSLAIGDDDQEAAYLQGVIDGLERRVQQLRYPAEPLPPARSLRVVP